MRQRILFERTGNMADFRRSWVVGGSCGSWVWVKVVGIKKIPQKFFKNINKTKGNIDISKKHLKLWHADFKHTSMSNSTDNCTTNPALQA